MNVEYCPETWGTFVCARPAGHNSDHRFTFPAARELSTGPGWEKCLAFLWNDETPYTDGAALPCVLTAGHEGEHVWMPRAREAALTM